MSQGCDKKTNAWRRIATDLGRGLEDDQGTVKGLVNVVSNATRINPTDSRGLNRILRKYDSK